MEFLTSRSASIHILFALGADPIARDGGECVGSELGKFVQCAVTQKLANCIAYRYTYVDRSQGHLLM